MLYYSDRSRSVHLNPISSIPSVGSFHGKNSDALLLKHEASRPQKKGASQRQYQLWQAKFGPDDLGIPSLGKDSFFKREKADMCMYVTDPPFTLDVQQRCRCFRFYL